VAAQTFTLQSTSIIYTPDFNTSSNVCSADNQSRCIYTAKEGESFKLGGTLLTDDKAPTSVKICLNFMHLDSEAYPICTTVNTSTTVSNYTFEIPTSTLPKDRDVFMSTTMTTTDVARGDVHTQPIHLILYVKRDYPAIVQATRQNSYVFMRNNTFN
jgi:hypothetical protein